MMFSAAIFWVNITEPVFFVMVRRKNITVIKMQGEKRSKLAILSVGCIAKIVFGNVLRKKLSRIGNSSVVKNTTEFWVQEKVLGYRLSNKEGYLFCLLCFRGRNDTCFGTVELELIEISTKIYKFINFNFERKWQVRLISLSITNMELVAELATARAFYSFFSGRKNPATEPSNIPRKTGVCKKCDEARRRTKNQHWFWSHQGNGMGCPGDGGITDPGGVRGTFVLRDMV